MGHFIMIVDLKVRNLIIIEKSCLPKGALFGIRNRFTKPNPEYHIVKNANFHTEVAPFIKYYFETDTHVGIPRGSGTWLRHFFNELGAEVNIIDDRVTHPQIDVELNYGAVCANGKIFKSLHNYQQAGVDYLIENQQAIFEADCGGGKTVVGVAAICALKQPAIIFVHTGDLAQQWAREMAEKTCGDAKVGLVGLGQFSPREITIATVQKVCRLGDKDKRSLLGQFGTVIMDECFPRTTKVWCHNAQQNGIWHTIEDVYNNDDIDSVIAYDLEEQRARTYGITRKIKTPYEGENRHWVQIKTRREKIKLTGNHKVFVAGEGWREASEIRAGDNLCWYRDPHFMKVEHVRKVAFPDGYEVFKYNLEVEKVHNYFADGFLVSNCHHAPANTFAEALNYCPGKYRFGLTATPKRSDGLEFLMYDIISNRSYRVDDNDMVSTGVRSIAPVISPVPSGYNDPQSYHINQRARGLTKLSKNENRNAKIISQMHHDWEAGYFALAISQRVEHCRVIAEGLKEKGMKVELLIGDVPSDKRKAVIQDARIGLVDCIVGTKVADEGLDIPQLDCFHLLMPHSNESKLKQQIGRIRRNADGCHDPLVRDYVDSGPMYARMWQKRLMAYRRWNFEIM